MEGSRGAKNAASRPVSGWAFSRPTKRGASSRNVSNARSTGKGQRYAHGSKGLAPFRKENERQAAADYLKPIESNVSVWAKGRSEGVWFGNQKGGRAGNKKERAAPELERGLPA